MIIEPAPIDGVFVLRVERVADERGWFGRVQDADALGVCGVVSDFPHHSMSYNAARGTTRGLHRQLAPYGEVKIVRCTRGRLWDVVVDVRDGSPTFARWFAIELDPIDAIALYVPDGFLHGFQTLLDDTDVHYQISTAYVPAASTGVRWDDATLAIAWPLVPTVVSKRDRELPDFDGARVLGGRGETL